MQKVFNIQINYPMKPYSAH